jgi:hypothetical protein
VTRVSEVRVGNRSSDDPIMLHAISLAVVFRAATHSNTNGGDSAGFAGAAGRSMWGGSGADVPASLEPNRNVRSNTRVAAITSTLKLRISGVPKPIISLVTHLVSHRRKLTRMVTWKRKSSKLENGTSPSGVCTAHTFCIAGLMPKFVNCNGQGGVGDYYYGPVPRDEL